MIFDTEQARNIYDRVQMIRRLADASDYAIEIRTLLSDMLPDLLDLDVKAHNMRPEYRRRSRPYLALTVGAR